MERENIIKALECCIKAESWGDCEDLGCPAHQKQGCYFYLRTDEDKDNTIYIEICKDALAIIKELIGELENLKKVKYIFSTVDYCSDDLADAYEENKQTKADTVRKMQERLKEEMENLSRMEYNGEYYFLVSKSFIDQIAKEMLDG